MLEYYFQSHDWLASKKLLENPETRVSNEVISFIETNLKKTTKIMRESIMNFFAEKEGIILKFNIFNSLLSSFI